MASTSIICRSQRLRQIIDLRDTDKSRYFAITKFNNCFIIQSPRLFFTLFSVTVLLSTKDVKSLSDSKSAVSITHQQNIICSKTQLDRIALEQTIICRSRGLLSANDKEGKNASNDNLDLAATICIQITEPKM